MGIFIDVTFCCRLHVLNCATHSWHIGQDVNPHSGGSTVEHTDVDLNRMSNLTWHIFAEELIIQSRVWLINDQDAKKMPALVQPRAEKRKLIEEELNCSLKVFLFSRILKPDVLISFRKCKMFISQLPQRRRVRLGSGALSLAGPPLRSS